jgi:protein-disulfide isomerase
MMKRASSERSRASAALDHDEFGRNRSELMNVIGSKDVERDASGKPVSGFPHPARAPHGSKASWRRALRGPLSAIFAAGALVALPAAAEQFTAAQKGEIEAIIKSYLLREPEVLRDAANALDERAKVAEAKARETVVADPAGTLYSDANQAVIGNPSGKITLVEFFDYNCGYCKRALGDLARLVKDNPDLRVVLRDLPILSENSEAAAQVANAARQQLDGPKFWELHQKLLATRGPVGKAEALAAAKALGVDMDKLAKDAEAAEPQVGIAESERLAKALGINGTPAYVVGQEVVIGAVGYDALQAKVVSTRKCGKAEC